MDPAAPRSHSVLADGDTTPPAPPILAAGATSRTLVGASPQSNDRQSASDVWALAQHTGKRSCTVCGELQHTRVSNSFGQCFARGRYVSYCRCARKLPIGRGYGDCSVRYDMPRSKTGQANGNVRVRRPSRESSLAIATSPWCAIESY